MIQINHNDLKIINKEYFYKGKLFYGLAHKWEKTGQLYFQEEYERGKLKSKWTYYFSGSGLIEILYECKGGKSKGEITVNPETGNIILEKTHENGLLIQEV